MLPLRLRFGLLGVALLAVVACTLPSRSRDRQKDEGELPAPVEAPADAKLAAGAVNAFAADLYSQLRAQTGNLVVSPYSVALALAMTRLGAEGTTGQELGTVLHLPLGGKTDEVAAFKHLTESVVTPPRSAKPRPELSVANSLWLEQGHPWKKPFLDAARGSFRAGVFDVNFRGNPEGARRSINQWVEKETHNRITDLVPPQGVTTLTRMVLANAIYFKARWAESFKKEDTRTEDFTLANGQKVRAALMHRRGDFRIWETDGFQVLKVPYDGKATSMYVFLPRTPDGLPQLEGQLDAAHLVEWTTIMGGGEVKVWLPRFKFTVPTELAEVLQQLGVREAFGPGANFKGMTDHPEGLVISRVIHKAFVETDEVGTEAAAATAVIALAGAAPVAQMPPPPVREFRADHPFLFVIKHEPTGAVLFVGRVLNPTT
jgi:serpin B